MIGKLGKLVEPCRTGDTVETEAAGDGRTCRISYRKEKQKVCFNYFELSSK